MKKRWLYKKTSGSQLKLYSEENYGLNTKNKWIYFWESSKRTTKKAKESNRQKLIKTKVEMIRM